ncbi:phosphotransferase [Microlunatus elymi]|uniref:Phosphotransferase n=1 Tax=Microlunatus elymi TaxID=2596828 RepID=A0A516PYC7_9ACTN|nr:phosphotransferase [Microlunatus elymi]QDP96177.1 phosphotransferase [Microlunatus elymi]
MTSADQVGVVEAKPVLACWQLEPAISMTRATSGTMNDTFIVTTEQRRVVLRRHRRRLREQVDHEHAVIAHARARQIPAPAAIPTADGSIVVNRDGVFFSLFEFANGTQLGKDDLTAGHAGAMGRTLALLHRAFEDFPTEPPSSQLRSETLDAAPAKITSLLEEVESRSDQTEQDRWAREHLQSKINWLSTGPTVDWRPVAADRLQMIHGDYQETNLFFDGEEVSAVIDWDKAEMRWPVDEVIRTMVRGALRL